MGGIGSHFKNKRAPTLIDMGWGEAIIIDDFEEIVEEERLGLRGNESKW